MRQSPQLANDAQPGEFRRFGDEIRVAKVGFDKDGGACLKWYLPKQGFDVRRARRLASEGKI